MPEAVELELDWREIHIAGTVAVSRTVINLSKGRQDAHGLEYQSLGVDMHWMGCIGEVALCRYLDRYWTPVTLASIDAGVAEVRATPYHKGRLTLHKSGDDQEKKDLPFVLAIVMRKRLPIVSLVGWMIGRDAMREEWWGEVNPNRPNGRPAYWVPTAELRPMEELKNLYDVRGK